MEVDVFTGKFFRVTTERLAPDLLYERVYQRPGVTVWPITDDGCMGLIRLSTTENPMPRITLVRGYVEDGETPLACAQRELAEETGLCAQSWTFYMEAAGTEGSLYKTQHIFIARGLRPVDGVVNQDPHEHTSLVNFTFAEVRRMVLAEELGRREDAFALLKFFVEMATN